MSQRWESTRLTVGEASVWFETHCHPNVLEPMAHAERKRYLALRDHGAIVATATLERKPLGIDQVGGIFVLPELRGTGLGRALMDAVVADSRDAGGRLLVLGAYRREPDVSPFYRACGFRTLAPFIPGAATPVLGLGSRLLARLVGAEAGPDSIRLMVRRP